MGGGIAKRRCGLHSAAISRDANEPVRLEFDLAQGAGVEGREELGQGDLARRGASASEPGQQHEREYEKATGHDDGGTTVTGCNAHGRWLRGLECWAACRAEAKDEGGPRSLFIGSGGKYVHTCRVLAGAIPGPGRDRHAQPGWVGSGRLGRVGAGWVGSGQVG